MYFCWSEGGGDYCFVLVVSSQRGEKRTQKADEEAGEHVQGECQVRSKHNEDKKMM